MSAASASGPMFPGVVVAKSDDMPSLLDTMDKAMREWTARAARGECDWVCADCCVQFRGGMPDECAHGHQGCTDIIKRDKAEAAL